MSERGLPWRAILWIERFLPTPAALPLNTERAAAAQRRAALVLPLIVTVVFVPAMARKHHVVGELLLLNHVVLEQLMLVAAGCVAVAAIGSGARAWCAARGAR